MTKSIYHTTTSWLKKYRTEDKLKHRQYINRTQLRKSKQSRTKLPWFSLLLPYLARKWGGLILQCSRAWQLQLLSRQLNSQAQRVPSPLEVEESSGLGRGETLGAVSPSSDHRQTVSPDLVCCQCNHKTLTASQHTVLTSGHCDTQGWAS